VPKLRDWGVNAGFCVMIGYTVGEDANRVKRIFGAIMSSQQRIILILLAALNFTHILDFMIMMPLGNYLMPYFNISGQRFSVIVAAYSVSACVASLVASLFVDGFDRKKVLLFGYIGFLLGTILCGFAPTANLLLAARIVAGLFGGLIGAQVLSIVADIFPYERRGQAMGYLMSAFSLASVFGVPFGLVLSNWFNWHATFLLVGGLGILLIPLLIRYIPSMTGHIHPVDAAAPKVRPIAHVASLLRNGRNRLALLLSGSQILGHFLIIPFINPFMEFNVGFTKDQTKFIYVVGGLVTLVSAPLAGRLADKVGKLKVFVVTALLSLAPIFLITNMPAIAFYYVLIVTGFWFLVANARGVTASALVSGVVPPEQRGSFMSLNSAVQQMSMGVAALIAGWIVVTDKATQRIAHYDWVGYGSLAVIFACIFLASKLGEQKQ
jgi:MFS transporter, DHA1 family, inner membrane transport protein